MSEPKNGQGIPKNLVKLDIDLDRILTEEVGFGLYQIKAIVLCCLISFFVGYSEMGYVFTAARVKTRCIIPECESKNEQKLSPSWISYAVPKNDQSYDSCHRYSVTNSSLNDTTRSCHLNAFDRNSIVKCTEYAYEHNNSAIYDFDFPCDEWRWFFIGSSQVLGTAIALPIAGYISDRWGRRFALSVFTFNYAWINTISYWSSSYTMFVICGFFGSFFGISNCNCVFVLLLELVVPKHRMVVSSIIATCFILGTSLLGLVAWTEPHWRNFILILYLPMFISITFYWIMPESVRWLMSKNRLEESIDNLIKAAKLNGRVLSEETVKSFSEDNVRKKERKDNETNIFALVFKHKAILLRCVITPIWWTSALFINNSLLISSVGISGNKYFNFSAVAAVAIPAYVVSTFFIDRIGRKPVLSGMYWVSGLSQLGYIFIPKGHYALSLCAYLVGKFSMAIVVSILYVYTSELFPTSHRNSLTTFASMVGRLGAFAAPITPALASQVWEHLPFILMAGCAFITGLLVLLAPETAGSTLPESMEDAEKLGKDAPSPIKDLFRRVLFKKQCYSLR